MKELIAVIITFFLVALIVIQNTPQDTSQMLPKAPSFSLEDVASFSLRPKDKPDLEAKREGDKWLLANSGTPTYLNALAVEQLLHDLQNMKVRRVASANPEQFSLFSVAEHEVVLQDKAGKVLLDVFIGKPATDLTSTYIRLADEKLVITVDKVLTWQVKRTQNGWLDPTEAKDVSTE